VFVPRGDCGTRELAPRTLRDFTQCNTFSDTEAIANMQEKKCKTGKIFWLKALFYQ
jgi:hypothetical protein